MYLGEAGLGMCVKRGRMSKRKGREQHRRMEQSISLEGSARREVEMKEGTRIICCLSIRDQGPLPHPHLSRWCRRREPHWKPSGILLLTSLGRNYPCLISTIGVYKNSSLPCQRGRLCLMDLYVSIAHLSTPRIY